MMNVSMSLDDLSITPSEVKIANALCESLKQDVQHLRCHHCGCESHVILHIDKSKMTALRTEIKACCPDFNHKIEEALLVTA